MKKTVAVLLVISIGVFAFACGNASKESNLGKGKVMALEFSTNPSTGFNWEYRFENGDGEITFDREENKLNEDMNLVGAPHQVVYYFRGAKEGTKNLVFTYRRPWEGGDVAYDVVYELSVDKDLNITCLSKMKGTVESNEDLSSFPNPTFTDN